MASTAFLKLKHRAQSLDLNDGNNFFIPDAGFLPPPTVIQPLISSVTGANRFKGGERVGITTSNKNFSFTLSVKGNSKTDIQMKVRILSQFLSRGSKDSPLIIEYRNNGAVEQEPFWGQLGANLRYIIVNGNISLGAGYSIGAGSSKLFNIKVSVVLAPTVLGQPQVLAEATGGVGNDANFWKDKLARGTQIPEAAVNVVSNPIFGHSIFNTNWNNGTSITDTQNKNKEFILFGKSSAKLVSVLTAGLTVYPNNSYTTDIPTAATTYTLSAYVKMPNGGAVTGANIGLVALGGTISTTITAIGDYGWSLLTGIFTGTGGTDTIGVLVSGSYTIYLGGMQAEQNPYATVLAYGDLKGHSWASTEHGSASTREVGRVRILVNKSIDIAESTFRIVWEADQDSADLTAANRIFEEEAGEIFLGYISAFTDWTLTDGINQATSSGETYQKGDKMVLHGILSPSDGVILYKDGIQIAINSTYTPPVLGTYLYVGSTDSISNHANGTFVDFSTFDRALTASEILVDYNEINEALINDQITGGIPLIWTDDGDNIIDNCLDLTGSTGAPHNNFAIIEGIPGTLPAATSINGHLGGGADSGNVDVWLSLLAADEYKYPDQIVFADEGGNVSVSRCGGFFRNVISITPGTGVELGTISPTSDEYVDFLAGREFTMFMNCGYAPASTLLINMQIKFGDTIISSEPISPGTGTGDVLTKVGTLIFPTINELLLDKDVIVNPEISIFADRTTGSDGLIFDFAMIMPTPIIGMSAPTTVSGFDGYIYEDRRAVIYQSSDGEIKTIPDLLSGQPLEFVPNKTNIMFGAYGKFDRSDVSLIAHTFEIQEIEITPRFALL